MRLIKIIIASVFCLAVTSRLGLAGSHNANRKIVVAFTKADKGMRRIAKPTNANYSVMHRLSPDGQFIAQLTMMDGEVAHLAVYRRQPAKPGVVLTKHAVSRRFDDVGNCIWVPRRGHWLLVSIEGADSGELEGMILLWTGSKCVRTLRRAKSRSGEGFNVRGVTADGRTMIYEHFGKNSPDPKYKRQGRLYMRLPRR